MAVRRRTARERQRGSVLVTVMVFMALLMLFATIMINHLLMSEADDVEALLADTRAHWAMVGQMNYMLSRASKQGLCAGGAKRTPAEGSNTATPCGVEDSGSGSYDGGFTGRSKNNRIGSLQDYLDGAGEIQKGGSLDNPGALLWQYPENPAFGALTATNPYWFTVRGVVSERILKATNAGADDGQVRLDLEVASSATAIPPLRHLASRVGRLTVGLCVVDGSTIVENGTTTHNVNAPFTNCAPDKPQGTARVQFIQRNFPFLYQ